MPDTVYRIRSSALFHTPGVVAWAMNDYRPTIAGEAPPTKHAKEARERCILLLGGMLRDLPFKVVVAVIDRLAPITTEGDRNDVCVITYPVRKGERSPLQESVVAAAAERFVKARHIGATATKEAYDDLQDLIEAF